MSFSITKEVAHFTEHRALTLRSSPEATRALKDTVRHSRKWQTLHEDRPVSSQRCKEKAFAAEKHRFEISRTLDVVLNPRGEAHQAARIYPKRLIALKLLLDHSATGVNQGCPITLEALHDEALATKKNPPAK